MTVFNAKQLEYIKRKRVAHLATCDVKGIPAVIPVCYAISECYIYTPIDRKPKKVAPIKLRRIKNIMENPTVSLVIDEYHEEWEKLSYIIIRGKAELIEHGDEHTRAVILLSNKYEQYRNMKLESLGLPVIKLVPEKVISWGDI